MSSFSSIVERFHNACITGDIEIIKSIPLDKNQRNAKSKGGLQALHFASMFGHLEVAQYLVSEGALINARDDSGMSPLHHACRNGHLEFVQWLLTQKIFKNNRNNEGMSPLLCAATAGHLEIVKLLLSEKVFDFIVDNDGNSALHLAYLKRQSALALWLIQYGMDVNLKNNHGLKPHEILGDDNISLIPNAAASSGSSKQSNATDADNAISDVKSNLDSVAQKIQHSDEKLTSQPVQEPLVVKSADGPSPWANILFRSASDPRCVSDVSLPLNASWDVLTDRVAKRLGFSSSREIHHLMLMSSTGDELSTMLRSSHSFWEVVDSMSVNTEDGMYFDVHVDRAVANPIKKNISRNGHPSHAISPTHQTELETKEQRERALHLAKEEQRGRKLEHDEDSILSSGSWASYQSMFSFELFYLCYFFFLL